MFVVHVLWVKKAQYLLMSLPKAHLQMEGKSRIGSMDLVSNNNFFFTKSQLCSNLRNFTEEYFTMTWYI